MTVPMVSIDNLTKSYGANLAVRGISFEIPRGQVVGFLGPNGAGKSTTLRILTGFVRASSGTVRVGGVDVSTDEVGVRRRIGYLPENNPLYDDMIVQELLEYTAGMRELPEATRTASIQRALQRCGLTKVRHQELGELSKGYRQRVGLACAILHDPDLLILDEPTSGLDPNQVVEIRELIRELGREKTVLMSTHVLAEVEAVCSRALIIADGRLVADGPPSVLTAEGHTVELLLEASRPAAEIEAVLREVQGVEAVERRDDAEPGALAFTLRSRRGDPRRALFAACVKHDLVLLGVQRRHVSLEETFRRLTQR